MISFHLNYFLRSPVSNTATLRGRAWTYEFGRHKHSVHNITYFFLLFFFFTHDFTFYIWVHMCWCLVTQSCPTLCDPMDCSPPGSSVHGDSPGKNTGVGCHALFQGIFPTQGSNPGLLHCRWILYCLSHQGSPIGLLEYLKWHMLFTFIFLMAALI